MFLNINIFTVKTRAVNTGTCCLNFLIVSAQVKICNNILDFYSASLQYNRDPNNAPLVMETIQILSRLIVSNSDHGLDSGPFSYQALVNYSEDLKSGNI